jgi:hypothetical protein
MNCIDDSLVDQHIQLENLDDIMKNLVCWNHTTLKLKFINN